MAASRSNSLSLLIKDKSQFDQIRNKIEAFCSSHTIPSKLEFHLILMIEELITNIFTYGYNDKLCACVPEIMLCVKVDECYLITKIRDNGQAFNPLTVAVPDLALPLQDRPLGGLGLHLVRQNANELDYQRHQGYNHLIVKQCLPGVQSKEANANKEYR